MNFIQDFKNSPHEWTNTHIQNIETHLNIGACVPFVAPYAIGMSYTLASAQVIIGLACAVIGKLGKSIAKNHQCDKSTIYTFTQLKDFGTEHFQQGILGLIRSTSKIITYHLTFSLFNLLIPLYKSINFVYSHNHGNYEFSVSNDIKGSFGPLQKGQLTQQNQPKQNNRSLALRIFIHSIISKKQPELSRKRIWESLKNFSIRNINLRIKDNPKKNLSERIATFFLNRLSFISNPIQLTKPNN